jgi:hypothetical protein
MRCYLYPTIHANLENNMEKTEKFHLYILLGAIFLYAITAK